MLALAEPHIMTLSPYVPGRSVKETCEQYGISNIVKLASNENPLGASPKALEAVMSELKETYVYPVANRMRLKEKICEYHDKFGLNTNQIVVGNGSNELITLLVRAFVSSRESILNAWPSFATYRIAAAAQNTKEVTISLDSNLQYDLDKMTEATLEESKHPIKLMFIANPNNPTGRYMNAQELDRFMLQIPEDIIVVLDEAYAEYVEKDDYSTGLSWIKKRERTVVLKTFSKIFGLAGWRIGYAVSSSDIASILHRIRDPFNVNNLAQVAAIAALDDAEHVARSKEMNSVQKKMVGRSLQELGLEITKSEANFLLIHLNHNMPKAPVVFEELLKRGVIVRPVNNYDLLDALRVSIGTSDQNHQFLTAISDILQNQ